MATNVIMPKLGMTMTEGTIIKWHKKVGDAIEEGMPLFDVETDKLTNTVNANVSGTLLKISVPEDGTADCLAVVAVIGSDGEKLEAERLAGYYDTDDPSQIATKLKEYNGKLQNIERGIETDWLALPLRTSFGHKHSIGIAGASDAFRYGLDLMYDDQEGVMKGQNRKKMSAALNLQYQYKGLTFRNQMTTTLVNSQESPYGTFSDYVRMNPYDTYLDENGNIGMNMATWHSGSPYRNPMYDATLGSFDKGKRHEFYDQFDVRYYLNGVLFVVEGKKLRTVATDTHRLACCEVDVDDENTPMQAIIPRKTVRELIRLLPEDDTPVRVQFTDLQVCFSFGNITFMSKLIEGRFPDYKRVLPSQDTNPNALELEREAISNALRRVGIMTNEKFHGIRWILNGEGLQIQSTNSDHEEALERFDVPCHARNSTRQASCLPLCFGLRAPFG